MSTSTRAGAGWPAESPAPNVTRLSSNSSRFGLRGTEALGGGLNAIWQIESSVSGDAGGGTIAGRDTFLGLQGSWGTVRFGNFLAPYDDVHPVFGDTGTYLTSIAAQAAIWANNGGYTKGTGSFDDRLGNSLRYDSPNIAGFTGSIQVALFDDAGRGRVHATSTVWSTAGQYKNGPFTGIVGFEYNNDVRCYNGNAGGTNATCGGAYTLEADDWAFSARGSVGLRHRARRRPLRAHRLRHSAGRPEARPVRRVLQRPGRPRQVVPRLLLCQGRQGPDDAARQRH